MKYYNGFGHPRRKHLSVLSMLVMTYAYFLYPYQPPLIASNLSKESFPTIRIEALQAQSDGDLDKADKLYSQALAEAENCHYAAKIIEFISRLVQVKIVNHQLEQTDKLVQEALKLFQTTNRNTASDSNLSVWMDDMAKAFISRAEHSSREDVKEYCVKHYIDIELATGNQYDPLLVGRIHLFTTYLQHDGRYQEDLPYEEKLVQYISKTRPTDLALIAQAHFTLCNIFLLAHKTPEARAAIHEWFSIKSRIGHVLGDEAALAWENGLISLEEGNLRTAASMCQSALLTQKHCVTTPVVVTGMYEAILGYIEKRLNNQKNAEQLLKESLDCFEKCSLPEINATNKFIHPEGLLYSGKVFAAEHLAQIYQEQGNKAYTHNLEMKAEKICNENTHWAASKNPDPSRFYIFSGHFPFPIDIAPARVNLGL